MTEGKAATTPQSSSGAAVTHGWGGRSATPTASLKDNQFGEDELLLGRQPGLAVNNYNFWRSPAYRSSSRPVTPSLHEQLSRRAAPGMVAPIVELPFGKGKKWANNSDPADWIARRLDSLGRSINMQSGFPLDVAAERQHAANVRRHTPAAELRVGVRPCARPAASRSAGLSADHPTATWINPAAFTAAPAVTFGNAPRTITDVAVAGSVQRRRACSSRTSCSGRKTVQMKSKC